MKYALTALAVLASTTAYAGNDFKKLEKRNAERKNNARMLGMVRDALKKLDGKQ